MSSLAILKPVISEKSFALAGNGVYVFQIIAGANKKVIAQQIHKLYNVDVIAVNTINIPGKVKKAGKRIGRRNDIRKALVRVKTGQKIAIFDEEDSKKEQKTNIKNDNNKVKTEKQLNDDKK